MSGPLVTVVIPCRDGAAHLEEAIASALSQSYQPIEVVVVDDGSRDASADLAGRHPVRVVRQPPAGVCAAVNHGVRVARGDLVVRLDADDVLHPSYVEETVAALYASPDAHFAYTGVELFGARAAIVTPQAYDASSLAEHNFIHASALVRRASFLRAGGYALDMTDARCEDWDLWLTFAELGMTGVLVPRPLLRYRQHARGGRNAPRISLQGARRELRTIARLQDHHPRTFAPPRLVARLARVPGRVLARRVTPRFALLLAGFYGVMLARAATGRGRP